MNKNKIKAGFTLMELLIVIAIIAVLTGIAIPIIHGSVVKAKAGVDMANVRSAKSVAVAQYLLMGEHSKVTYYFDKNISISDNPGSIQGYGKSSVDLPGPDNNLPDDHAVGIPKDGYISITVSSDLTLSAKWNGNGSSGGGGSGNPDAFEKVFNTTLTWDEIKANKNNVTLTWGTVFSDGDTQYLVFGTKNNYENPSSYSSAADFVNANNAYMLELSSTIIPLKESYIEENKTVEKGTIWLYGGKYYVARENQTSYGALMTPDKSANWAEIKGQ